MQAQADFRANDCPHHPQCTSGHGPCWDAFVAVCGMGVGMMGNVAMGNDPFNMTGMNMGLNVDMKVSGGHHHHPDGASVAMSMPGMQVKVSSPSVHVSVPAVQIASPSISMSLPGVNVSLPSVSVALPTVPLPFPVQAYSGSKSFVEIFLDKPYYLAGEKVTGHADLSVHQHISSASCLMIKWKGFERTMIEKWVDKRDANGVNQREQVKIKENKDFFSQALTLFNFGGAGVGCGKYTFPFTYQLPATLPGVFYDEQKEIDGSKLRCAIVYKVKCWLDMKGKDIKKDYKIVISEPVTKQIVPVHAEKSKSFLLARGDLKLKADLPKNVWVPGETIPVHVIVDNESSKKVDALKVKLMRTIKIKAQHEKREHCYEVHRMKYDGVDPKSKKDTVLNFTLDNKIYPSTDGSLVDCKYHLDVECDVAMAIDLEVHPKITVALLPAANQAINLYENYGARGW